MTTTTTTTIDEIIADVLASGLRLGAYQRDVLTGRARWSGADLRGRARQYGGRYAEARRAALVLVQAEAARRGLRVALVDGTSGKPLRLAIVGGVE